MLRSAINVGDSASIAGFIKIFLRRADIPQSRYMVVYDFADHLVTNN